MSARAQRLSVTSSDGTEDNQVVSLDESCGVELVCGSLKKKR